MTFEVAMTNADKIRQMTDEEMIEEIYRLQGVAAVCPKCYQQHGKERLKYYLTREIKETKDED